MALVKDEYFGKTLRKSFAKLPRHGRHHRLHRQSGAFLPGLHHERQAQVHRGGMQGARRHLRPAHQGPRPAAQQGDRRDQGAGDLHGRLPHDDQRRHLRHQRRGARHRLPDRPLPRYVLRRRGGQGRPAHLHRHRDPLSRRMAGIRGGPLERVQRPHRQEPQAAHHLPDPRPGRGHRSEDPRSVRRGPADHRHPGKGHLPQPRGQSAGDLPQAASRRAPHGGQRQILSGRPAL